MPTLEASPTLQGPDSVQLSNAQTGNGQSTNVMDRGGAVGPALLKLTTTVGATPTVTITIEGSADGVNFYPVAYALATAPTSVVVANIVITTATTNYYIIQPNVPVRFLRLTYSANTNVTTTADLTAFAA